jgi:hypothetical protein
MMARRICNTNEERAAALAAGDDVVVVRDKTTTIERPHGPVIVLVRWAPAVRPPQSDGAQRAPDTERSAKG